MCKRTSLFFMARKYVCLLLCLLTVTGPAVAECRQTATLQSAIQPASLSNDIQDFITGAMREARAPWAIPDGPVYTFTCMLTKDAPGMFRDIIKCIGIRHTLVAYQLKKNWGSEFLSVDIVFDEKQNKEKALADAVRKLQKLPYVLDIFVRDGEHNRDIVETKGRGQEPPRGAKLIREEKRTFYVGVHMPYSMENLFTITDVFANLNVSLDSFFLPYQETKDKKANFHFEVSITEQTFRKKFNSKVDRFVQKLTRRIGTRMRYYIPESDVTITENYSIIEHVVEKLLNELPVDTAGYQEAIIASSRLLSDTVGQLRRDNRTPYIIHQIRAVQALVNEIGVDDGDALGALLHHDTVEDGFARENDLSRFLSELSMRLVLLLTRWDKKSIENDRHYFREKILDEKETVGALVVILKMIDRLQNLRSLNVGRPEFQRKIFFLTLVTLYPDLVQNVKEKIDIYPPRFRQYILRAITTIEAEIVFRGIFFGFFALDGTVNAGEFERFIRSHNEYYEHSETASSELLTVIEERKTITYMQGIADALHPYFDTFFMSYRLYDTINNNPAYVSVKEYLEKAAVLSSFFPRRIKSSLFVFLRRLEHELCRLHGVSSIGEINDFSTADIRTVFMQLADHTAEPSFLINEIARIWLSLLGRDPDAITALWEHVMLGKHINGSLIPALGGRAEPQADDIVKDGQAVLTAA